MNTVQLIWFSKYDVQKLLRFERFNDWWHVYDQTSIGPPVNWITTVGRRFRSLDECKSFLAEKGWFATDESLMKGEAMMNLVPADVKRVNSWTYKFMALAKQIASWSKDPSTKVGAIITDRNNIIRGQGYNGFPRGVDDSPVRYANRDIKYKMVVHAELNAILNSNGGVRGCTIYSTFFPCPQCAAAIIQSGITMVIAAESPSDDRWKEDMELSKTMFNEAGVTYMVIQPMNAA